LKNEVLFDIGLGILRPILAFCVIISHCYNPQYAIGKWKFFHGRTQNLYFHVPIFFIMAFYFSHKTFVSSNLKKKNERIQRLIIPYALWPIIFYFMNNNLLKKYRIVSNIIPFGLLKSQLLFGVGLGFMGILWFQWNLIIITILYFLIIIIFGKNTNIFLIFIGITSFIYQYNGKNKLFFSKYKGAKNYDFGRLLEMIPYSVFGFLVASSEIMKFLKKYKIKVILSCIYVIYFILNYNIFVKINGHGYHGMERFFLSISIFIAFGMFPSEKIKNKIIIKFIKLITNYTAAIFYLHVAISKYIGPYFILIQKRTMKGCIILYLICYFIGFMGSLIFGKTKLRHLFQ
jgi:hypothetical protein